MKDDTHKTRSVAFRCAFRFTDIPKATAAFFAQVPETWWRRIVRDRSYEPLFLVLSPGYEPKVSLKDLGCVTKAAHDPATQAKSHEGRAGKRPKRNGSSTSKARKAEVGG